MSETHKAALGQVVKRMRKGKGWTQIQLGQECDITRCIILEIEDGTGNPTLSTLCKLSTGLGVGLSEIFCQIERIEEASW